MLDLDHILHAVPDLQKGIEDFEKLTGVRPVYGGNHPSLGTHNALVSLGGDVYFELIASDPNSSIPPENIIFGIGKIKSSQIMTWAIRSTDISELGKKFRIAGIENGGRIKEDGTHLKWKTAHFAEFGDQSGIIPFVIQWVSKPHPANVSPQGCKLLQFSAEHPYPNQFAKLFSELSFSFSIIESQTCRFTLRMNTPKGAIEIH